MAQTKKTTSKKNTRKYSGKKTKNNAALPPLFSANHKTTFTIVMLFVSLLMCAVVLVDGGSVWGGLRNFIFGVFGVFGFFVPFATILFFAGVIYLLIKYFALYLYNMYKIGYVNLMFFQ